MSKRATKYANLLEMVSLEQLTLVEHSIRHPVAVDGKQFTLTHVGPRRGCSAMVSQTQPLHILVTKSNYSVLAFHL